VSLPNALEGLEISPRKREALALNHTHGMPNRVELWVGAGMPLVIGQWKTGLLVDRVYLDEAFERLESAVKRVAG